MIEEQQNGIIESIVIKENAYYFFVASQRQVEDIVQFCCQESGAAVLGVDTTFNLCNLWVTDSCYRNARIVNATGNHPVFLGPLMFHFTKDESTFTRFALEMMALNASISRVKKIGVDMEEAIFNGINAVIPNSQALYCIRHLKQRDEAKLDKLFAKLGCTQAEKNKAKSSILKDIYGDRKGTLLEYGLSESLDKADFNSKLSTLNEKWENYCPGFFAWFLKNRKETFEESVIASAREGTNIAGVFYQNDVESLHYIEKRNQCLLKKTVIDALKSLSNLAKRQENDEIRAIYGAGNYSLSTPYIKFKVDSARWHSWGESRRLDHYKKFRAYKPNPSDQFQRPKNVGRKKSYVQRKRSQEPIVFLDRIEEQFQ